VAVAAAGPHASLHYAQTDNHTSTPPLSLLQAGCPSYHPTNSVKALKAVFYAYGSKPTCICDRFAHAGESTGGLSTEVTIIIVATVVALLVVAAIVIICVLLVVRRRTKRRKEKGDE